MPIIATADITPNTRFTKSENLQVYNGLDTCVTFEANDRLLELPDNDPYTYSYERALQGPMLEIMLRGFQVDETSRRQALAELGERLILLNSILDEFAQAVWDKPLNPRSRDQLLLFFYSKMKLPEIWTSKKGVKKLSMDRETLEKLDTYFHARPIIATILAIRDTTKQIETLSTQVDPDGRMRTSYNIAGTETWRLSSSKSAEWTGGNLQNITQDLRYIFVPDPGKKLCVIDEEQAESREVGLLLGLLFDDWTYLDACESGDLHTNTSKLIWPGLKAKEDLTDANGKVIAPKGTPFGLSPKADRAIADQSFYRHFSHRDMSKRGGHGVSYYGTPFTMARHLKVLVKLMEDFQLAFFGAYPGIPRWHQWVATQLQTTHALTNPFGCTRHFFGRPGDDTTLREAIAFSPQSSTAIRTNLWLYKCWSNIPSPKIELLAQTHDSLTFQYDERDELEIIPEVLAHLSSITHTVKGRVVRVPGEAKTGWNWMAHHNESKPIGPGNRHNPNGLKKWTGKPDGRQRISGTQRTF